MAISRTALKQKFEQGDHPSEQDFIDLIDNLVHIDDDLSAAVGSFASVSEAEQGVVQNKYMNPFLVKVAIDYLVKDGVPTSRDTLAKLSTVLQGLIDNHVGDTSNPHQVTSAQVGLGNLPNAKSDDWSLNDSNTLATTKTTNNLYNEVETVKLKARVQTQNSGAGAGIQTHSESKVLSTGVTYSLINSTTLRVTHNLNSNLYFIKGFNSNSSTTAGLGVYSDLAVLDLQANYVDLKVNDLFSIVTFVLIDYGLVGGGSSI